MWTFQIPLLFWNFFTAKSSIIYKEKFFFFNFFENCDAEYFFSKSFLEKRDFKAEKSPHGPSPWPPSPLWNWHGQFRPLLVHVVYEWPLTKFITKSSITLCAHLSKVLKTAFLCRCDWRRGNFHQSDVINALGRAGLLSGTTSTNPLSRTLLICNRHHFTQCIQSQ